MTQAQGHYVMQLLPLHSAAAQARTASIESLAQNTGAFVKLH